MQYLVSVFDDTTCSATPAETGVIDTFNARLEDRLAGYHAYHATRADLMRRLGRRQESRTAYGKATQCRATPPRPPT